MLLGLTFFFLLPPLPALFSGNQALFLFLSSLYLSLSFIWQREKIIGSFFWLFLFVSFFLFAMFSILTSTHHRLSLFGDTASLQDPLSWLTFFLLAFSASQIFTLKDAEKTFKGWAALAALLALLTAFPNSAASPFHSPYLLVFFLIALLPLLFPLSTLSVLLLFIAFTKVITLSTLGLTLFFLLALLLSLLPRLVPLLPILAFGALYFPAAPAFFPDPIHFQLFSLNFWGFHFLTPQLFSRTGLMETTITSGLGMLMLLLFFFSFAFFANRKAKSKEKIAASASLMFMLFFFSRWDSLLLFPFAFLVGSLLKDSPASLPSRKPLSVLLPVVCTLFSLLLLTRASFFLIAEREAGQAKTLAYKKGVTDIGVAVHLKKALQFYPFLTPYRTALALSYTRAQRFQEAIASYHKALLVQRPEVYWDLAQALKYARQFEESRKTALTAISYPYFQLYRGMGEFWVFVGDSFFEEGKYKNALIAYREAARFPYPYDILSLRVGLCFMRLKQYQKAIQYFEKAYQFSQDPDLKAGVLYNTGIVYLSLQQKSKAIRTFRRALSIAKRNELKDAVQNMLLYLKSRQPKSR